MPRGAAILRFGLWEAFEGGAWISAGRQLSVWALCDTSRPKEDRVFRVVGTGHDLPAGVALVYVGSTSSGPFVWHLFEEVRSHDPD
jgi:hypothetical protein